MDKAHFVEMANELTASGLLDGTMVPVLKLIDRTDIVVAVWQDAQEPDGVGMLIVKGDRALLTIVADAQTKAVTMAAIPCICAEQAIALKEVAGEPKALN